MFSISEESQPASSKKKQGAPTRRATVATDAGITSEAPVQDSDDSADIEAFHVLDWATMVTNFADHADLIRAVELGNYVSEIDDLHGPELPDVNSVGRHHELYDESTNDMPEQPDPDKYQESDDTVAMTASAPTPARRMQQSTARPKHTSSRRGSLQPHQHGDTEPRPAPGSAVTPFEAQADSGADTNVKDSSRGCSVIKQQAGRIISFGGDRAVVLNFEQVGTIDFAVRNESFPGWHQETMRDVKIIAGAEFIINSKLFCQKMGYRGTETEAYHKYNHIDGSSFKLNRDGRGREFIRGWLVHGDTPLDRVATASEGGDASGLPAGKKGPENDVSQDELLTILRGRVEDLDLTAEVLSDVDDHLAKFGNGRTADEETDFLYRMHCILGHRSMGDLAVMLRNMGVPLSTFRKIFCLACEKAKAKRATLTSLGRRMYLPAPIIAFNPNFSCDAWGPVMPDLWGNCYCWTFIQQKTGRIVYVPTKSLANWETVCGPVIQQFREWMAMSNVTKIEVQLTEACVRVRGDSAQTFTSKAKHEQLIMYGIVIDVAAPYTPSSNPYQERNHTSIFNMMWAMLYHSYAPLAMWSLAQRYACTLFEMLPTAALKNEKDKPQSPLEHTTGFTPNWNNLHCFFSVCAVYVIKARRRKGDPKAIIGRWAGHDMQRRAHIVLVYRPRPDTIAEKASAKRNKGPVVERWSVRYSAHVRVDPSSRKRRPGVDPLLRSSLNVDPDSPRFHNDGSEALTGDSTERKVTVTPMAIHIPCNGGWSRVITAEGISYYHHSPSGATQWTVPTQASRPLLPNDTRQQLAVGAIPVAETDRTSIEETPTAVPNNVRTCGRKDGTCSRPLNKTQQKAGDLLCRRCFKDLISKGHLPAHVDVDADADRSDPVSFKQPRRRQGIGPPPTSDLPTPVGQSTKKPKSAMKSPATARKTVKLKKKPKRKPKPKPTQSSPANTTQAPAPRKSKTSSRAAARQPHPLAQRQSTRTRRPSVRFAGLDPGTQSLEIGTLAYVTGFESASPDMYNCTVQSGIHSNRSRFPGSVKVEFANGTTYHASPDRILPRNPHVVPYSGADLERVKIINQLYDHEQRQRDLEEHAMLPHIDAIKNLRNCHANTPAINAYYAMCDPNSELEPANQIQHAAWNDNHNRAVSLFLAFESTGDIKWIPGSEDVHGATGPRQFVRTIKQAQAKPHVQWMDRTFFNIAAAMNPANPHRHLVKPATLKEVRGLFVETAAGREPPLKLVQPSDVPKGTKARNLICIWSFKPADNLEPGLDNPVNVKRGKLRITYNGAKDKLDPTYKPDVVTHAPSQANLKTIMALRPEAPLLDPEDDVIVSGDLTQAYTYAGNPDDEWVEIPEWMMQYLPDECFPDGNRSTKCGNPWYAKVVGNLYGKINAGNVFENARNDYFVNKLGLTKHNLEPSCYYSFERRLVIMFITDDGLWRGKRTSAQWLEKNINSEFGDCGATEIRDEWKAYGGVLLRRDEKGLVQWSSSKAIKEALTKHFPDGNLASKKLPSPGGTATTKFDAAPEGERDQLHVRRYLSRQGSLNWIVSGTGRLDAAVAAHQLSSVMIGPKPSHFMLQNTVFSYLQYSCDMYITWNPANSPVRTNQLCYYSDGSFAGEQLQSRMGYVGLMNGGTVSSESKTAKFMCSGVFDVEEAAACLASKDIVYRKGFIEELGFPQDNIPVYCDNAATVLFSASTKITSLNKHILIRGAYTRDLQKQGVITLIFCPGKLNLADQQTKNLYGETFYGFLPMYGFVLIPSYP